MAFSDRSTKHFRQPHLWRSLGAFWDALWLQPLRWEDEMFQDLRYGVRMLLKHKGFTTVAVLSLALGIGANTAIFSLIDAMLLKSLPVKDPEHLVVFSIVSQRGTDYTFNYPLIERFNQANHSFAGIIASNAGDKMRLSVTEPGSGGQIESVQAEQTQNALPEAPLAAVINQTMARDFFGNENPLGKHFDLVGGSLKGTPHQVIGVVKDAKYSSLRETTRRAFYVSYFQNPGSGSLTFLLRTTGNPVDFCSAVRRTVREIDPRLQVMGLKTMDDVVNESLVQERFVAQLASFFSLFALLLACIELYGVMSYAVTRRTSEIGISMALGACSSDVVRLVMKETMWLVVIGVAIGLSAALATTRLISTLLFGLTPTDPLTIALAALLMIAVAALAGYLPARSASRVDAMTALRYE